MFSEYAQHSVQTKGAIINCVVGGDGPPLLLLHGYPQTHVMWHKVAERLKNKFTIVATDLRGYGDSSKPGSVADHSTYSKRAMAQDQLEVMQHLGFDRFYVGAHDRGARVAHRLGLDHPQHVIKMVVLDIAPTREMYAHTSREFAQLYWHWFFLIQPAPFPETMIAENAEFFLRKKMGTGSAGFSPFTDNALDEYIRCFKNPETIRATCEDYRAAATIDIQHDDEDEGRKLEMPLLAMWGEHGVIEACFDCIALWRERASAVTGGSLPGGHYLAEELPDQVAHAFEGFFERN